MNPIRARLKQHGAGGYGQIEKYEAHLYQIYIHARMRIETQLERFMADRRSSFTGPRLVKLMEEIQEVFPEFEEQYRETYEHALSYMAKKNYQQVLYDMGLDEPVYGKLDKSLYENMRDDAFTHIAGATRNMEKEIVSNLRKMSAQVMREAALTGETRAAVSRRLAFANQYGSGSIFQRPGSKATFVFRDAANREWKTDAYFKMLGRTLLHNNSRETYIAACAKEGNDIVTVSVSGNSCDHCRQWENHLLSISGKTPGLPTLQSAMSSGLFHPNCTHRIVAVPESVAKRYYDAQGKPVEEEKTEKTEKTEIQDTALIRNVLRDIEQGKENEFRISAGKILPEHAERLGLKDYNDNIIFKHEKGNSRVGPNHWRRHHADTLNEKDAIDLFRSTIWNPDAEIKEDIVGNRRRISFYVKDGNRYKLVNIWVTKDNDGKAVFEIVDGWYPNKQYIDHLGSKHKKKVPAVGVEPTGDAKTPVRTATQNRNHVNNNTPEMEKVKSDEINPH